MLFKTPEIGQEEERVLNLIRRLWQELRFNLQQRPRRWAGILARNLRARAIQGSNSIEGYIVNKEDALAAVDGDQPEEADEKSWINVVSYRHAMDYVLQLSNVVDFSYTKDLIRSLHFMMLGHDLSANPGTWRPGPVFVRNSTTGELVYEAPPAEDVPHLIEELVTEITRSDSDTPTRMVRAAMAHLNLVMVHPFSDGNGRMSRCLHTLVLTTAKPNRPNGASTQSHLLEKKSRRCSPRWAYPTVLPLRSSTRRSATGCDARRIAETRTFQRTSQAAS